MVEGVLGDDALVRRVVEHLGDEVDAGVVEARRVEVGDAVAQRLRLPLGELGLVVGELKEGGWGGGGEKREAAEARAVVVMVEEVVLMVAAQ